VENRGRNRNVLGFRVVPVPVPVPVVVSHAGLGAGRMDCVCSAAATAGCGVGGSVWVVAPRGASGVLAARCVACARAGPVRARLWLRCAGGSPTCPLSRRPQALAATGRQLHAELMWLPPLARSRPGFYKRDSRTNG
jgi:hypothetical protein